MIIVDFAKLNLPIVTHVDHLALKVLGMFQYE